MWSVPKHSFKYTMNQEADKTQNYSFAYSLTGKQGNANPLCFMTCQAHLLVLPNSSGDVKIGTVLRLCGLNLVVYWQFGSCSQAGTLKTLWSTVQTIVYGRCGPISHCLSSSFFEDRNVIFVTRLAGIAGLERGW